MKTIQYYDKLVKKFVLVGGFKKVSKRLSDVGSFDSWEQKQHVVKSI